VALVSFHDIKEGSLSLLSTVSFLVQTPGSARLVARIHFSRGVWSARLLLRFLLEFFALSLEFSGWVNVISLLSLGFSGWVNVISLLSLEFSGWANVISLLPSVIS